MQTVARITTSIFVSQKIRLLGNRADKRQISKLVGCHLQLIGTLEFDHYHGAGTNFNDEKIYLCFNTASNEDNRKCRFASAPDSPFEEVSSTVHEHRYTNIAASQSECFLNYGQIS